MPLAPEFEAPPRQTSTRTLVADEVWRRAAHQDGRRIVPVARDGRRGGTEDQLENRWLLYLQAAYGDDDWHLVRVDLHAPLDPPTDLTPLPPGSRVFTVDPLVLVPGAVLVTTGRRPDQVDHVLVDVTSGRATADLPAGADGRRSSEERHPWDPPGRAVLGDGPR